MSYAKNPYSAPQQGYQYGARPAGGGGNLRRADVGKRILGALLDGFVPPAVIGIPFGILAGIAAALGDAGVIVMMFGFIYLGIASLGITIAQIYFLATRSQSIGKMIVKTRIMDVETNQPADFVKSFLLRGLVHGLISGICIVGTIYAIIDIIHLFNDDHRTLHDKLAGTWVADVS